MNKREARAIILAAGRGSRLDSFTDKTPKCLVQLNGSSLLEWQIKSLRAAGIKQIAVVLGYKSELIATESVTRFKNENWANTNMVMSLFSAREWLQNSDCIISYSDIVYASEWVSRLLNSNGEISLTYDIAWKKLWEARFKNPLNDAESFRIDGSGLIKSIGEKVSSIDEIEGQYMGLIKLTPLGWALIENYLQDLKDTEKNKLDMTRLFSILIERGTSIQGVPVEGRWLEVDHVSDLQLYRSNLEFYLHKIF